MESRRWTWLSRQLHRAMGRLCEFQAGSCRRDRKSEPELSLFVRAYSGALAGLVGRAEWLHGAAAEDVAAGAYDS